MTWHNKVVWTEGLFLQAQHFQQNDRYAARQLHQCIAALEGCAWGFSALVLDEAALALGCVQIQSAQGLLPDGTAFSIPGSDPAPAALTIPADIRDERVVLAVALARAGVVESNAELSQAGAAARFQVAEVEVGDTNAPLERQALLQVGRLNFKLLLARDAVSASSESYAALAVAQVTERRADNKLILNNQDIPPLLSCAVHPVLAGYLRELCGLLHQRGETLASRLAQPGRGGVAEIADFLMLQTINRNEPLFVQLQQRSVLHPQVLYAACLSLAGELATFSESRRPASFPEYVHNDPAPCFKAVMRNLRQSLSMTLNQTAIPIELQDRKFGVRVGVIADVDLQRNANFVLAVSAQVPAETLRARFPTQVKVGPVERIRDLVNLQLPGVPLRPLAVAPRQIPYHANFTYFELDTRQSELWKQLETSGGLALHIAGEFPGLELALWAIRG